MNARIGNETDLLALIPKELGSISSCALTARALAMLASNNRPAAVQNLKPMKPREKVARIDEQLDRGNLVAVSISPDHHFLVVPGTNDNVALLQAFQGVYNYVEWRTARSNMAIDRRAFTNAMLRLTFDNNKAARLDAAAELFAFATVEQEVRQYFSKDNPVEINNITYQAI